jgi:hypothetical protein
MSHPNPYLFHIIKSDGKLVAEWMITSDRSYPQQDEMDSQGCTYYSLEKMSCIIVVRTHVDV